MKTINLKGISETLGEKELKNVIGGDVTSQSDVTVVNATLETYVGDFDVVVDVLSAKQEACKGKSSGTKCSFKDNRGVTKGGKCVQFLWSPMHCSDLN